MNYSKFNLSGRKALITGSSRGIGKAIALGLASEGAETLIHYNKNKEQAQKTESEISEFNNKTKIFSADLSEKNSIKKLYDFSKNNFDNIDILVLNVAIQFKKDWLDITYEEFNKQVKVNLYSSLKLMQYFIPDMKAKKWGRVLTIGSVQQAKPHPQMITYAATKMAQLSIVRNLALQLAENGITINNLAPGVIDTDRNTEYLQDKNYYNKILSKIPVKYIGMPDDCVGAAILLCSEAGRYITGENIYIDGGMKL